MQDWGTLRFAYHDYFLFAPTPASSETISFSDFLGTRSTPSSVLTDDVEEIVAAKPTHDYDEQWGGGFLKADKWVEIVHAGMVRPRR